MIKFATSIRVERPIDDVFIYVSEVANFPHWNSAVQAARRTSRGDTSGVGATYALLRTLPTGQARNNLEVEASERPTEFAIRTTSGPTPFAYRYGFIRRQEATVVRLQAEVDLGGPVGLLAPLVQRAVRKGVDENLATLKAILEMTRPNGGAQRRA